MSLLWENIDTFRPLIKVPVFSVWWVHGWPGLPKNVSHSHVHTNACTVYTANTTCSLRLRGNNGNCSRELNQCLVHTWSLDLALWNQFKWKVRSIAKAIHQIPLVLLAYECLSMVSALNLHFRQRGQHRDCVQVPWLGSRSPETQWDDGCPW